MKNVQCDLCGCGVNEKEMKIVGSNWICIHCYLNNSTEELLEELEDLEQRRKMTKCDLCGSFTHEKNLQEAVAGSWLCHRCVGKYSTEELLEVLNDESKPV